MVLQALDLAMENLDKIISQAGDKSAEREAVEGVLNVVCYVFGCVLEGSKSPADLVDSFVKKLGANTTHSAIRLKTMASVYNLLEGNSAARYATILAMISYASSAGKDALASVAPSSAASGEVCSLRAASIDPSALESCVSSMDPIVTARGETLAWSRIADSTFPR